MRHKCRYGGSNSSLISYFTREKRLIYRRKRLIFSIDMIGYFGCLVLFILYLYTMNTHADENGEKDACALLS